MRIVEVMTDEHAWAAIVIVLVSMAHRRGPVARRLRLALLVALVPGGAAARYYLCAFQCPGCSAPWSSCRPEPCDAALAEDACADGSEPTRVQLIDTLYTSAAAVPSTPSPRASEAQPDELVTAEASAGASPSAAERAARLLPLLRRNGTEAHLSGPAHCLDFLPPARAPSAQQAQLATAASPSTLTDAKVADRHGLPRGVPPFWQWGTFKERCAVASKLSLAAERVLAEAGRRAPAGEGALEAGALCELAMARARRGLRSMRSCHLGRADGSPDSQRQAGATGLCEELARSLWPVTCGLVHAAAQHGNSSARARAESARLSGLLLSARRGAAGEPRACGAVSAAVECEAEVDRPPWIIATVVLCAAGLFAVQVRSFKRFKLSATVDGYLPDE